MDNNVNVNETTRLPLIGDKAPAFKAVTTQGEINFPQDFSGKWVILFSHPADFTPVCTTEFMTFASMAKEFEELNTALVGLSIDSLHSHIAWLRGIQKLEWNGIVNPEVKFPLIVDIDMNVSTKYGMVHPNSGSTTSAVAVSSVNPAFHGRDIRTAGLLASNTKVKLQSSSRRTSAECLPTTTAWVAVKAVPPSLRVEKGRKTTVWEISPAV